MDALLAGALVALAWHLWPEATRQVSRWTGVPGAVVVAFLLLGYEASGVGVPMYYTLLTWSSAAVIALLACGDVLPVDRAFAWAPLVWMGKISYGIYLWHFPLQALLIRHLEISYDLRLPAVLVLATGCAWLSARVVEAPLSRRLRPLVTVRPR